MEKQLNKDENLGIEHHFYEFKNFNGWPVCLAFLEEKY